MTTRARTDTPQAAAIYCRISLDRTGEGLGVDRQETLCRGLARDRGWPVAEVYVDNDKSASNGKPRPAYQRMVGDIESGLRDAVLCVDLDRLTRRPAELETFMELADRRGVALANVSGDTDLSSSDGRFKARIMGAVARQESEKKAERMRREAEQAARRGIARGSRRPFGYEPDRVTIREEEAVLIRAAVQCVLDGVTVPSVARDWNTRGIPTSQGAKHGWLAASVAAVLRNPRIAGLRTYRGEIVAEACWPAIIDRDTFERVQAKLRRTARPGRSPKRLLTGIARCGRCGSPLWTSTRYDGTKQIARYACIKRPGSPGCGGTTIVAEPFDQLISGAVLHRLSTKTMVQALTRKPKKGSCDVDVAGIERDLEDLAADFGAGDISRREWLAARKPLEERLAKARRTLEASNGTTALAPLLNTQDVQAAWDRLDVDRKRAVLNALIDRIVISPAARPGCRFDPERVEIEWKV